ncbi:cupredoxin domain-containing protein [Halobellus rufus]|uniref:cupredoxin domain-containing protein n=1 Tax=Halobellus rufus TaxID=1448860 RepID=UPI0006786625|nr:plastocyanin/azurin family copper-binding protein [Halobellus rufus]
MTGQRASGDERLSRRRVLGGAVAAVTVGLAGCSSSSAEDDYDVGMTASAFTPPELTIEVGETVVWRNTSSRGHTITAYDSGIPEDAEFFATGDYDSTEAAREAFRSEFGGSIDSGATWSHTFEVPGEYEYFCIPHEQGGMVGTIVVEE